MSRDWHSTFSTWAKPPSETEEEKATNAARMINDAIRKSAALSGRNFEVYASGSFRNNTNTRSESDIDVAVVLKDAFFYELPANLTKEMLGISDAKYGFADFREDVGRALAQAFGTAGMTAGDKTFDIHENSYRLDADVTAFLAHRRYTGEKDSNGYWSCYSGVEMRPRSDSGRRIINWHQQHYDEGVARNTVTGRRYKRVVRILKRLREEMKVELPSFLIECLCFNATDGCFNRQGQTYYDDVAAVVSELWNATGDQGRYSKLREVSKMKWLFGSGNLWKPEVARDFLLRAWQYVGFK